MSGEFRGFGGGIVAPSGNLCVATKPDESTVGGALTTLEVAIDSVTERAAELIRALESVLHPTGPEMAGQDIARPCPVRCIAVDRISGLCDKAQRLEVVIGEALKRVRL